LWIIKRLFLINPSPSDVKLLLMSTAMVYVMHIGTRSKVKTIKNNIEWLFHMVNTPWTQLYYFWQYYFHICIALLQQHTTQTFKKKAARRKNVKNHISVYVEWKFGDETIFMLCFAGRHGIKNNIYLETLKGEQQIKVNVSRERSWCCFSSLFARIYLWRCFGSHKKHI
jgi:hypothetical protein